MDRKQVLDGIEKLSPWFHKIELTPFGVSTKEKSNFGEDPDHPLPTWRHVSKCFPADLTGKTVLDIGCNGGFYAFEARKRNALNVLGVDANNWHVRQARFVQAALGLDRMSFSRRSIYELDPREDGQWDMVLALGLVYHLKHLVLGLENLYKITRETLILESAIALPGMAGSSGSKSMWSKKTQPVEMQPVTMEYGNARKQFMPLFYVKNDQFATEAAENWFLPTPETLVGMLQDVGFNDVECIETFNGRALIRAIKSTSVPNSERPIWLKAEYRVDNLKTQYLPGESVELVIRASNVEFSTWLQRGVDSRGKGAVSLCSVITSEDDYTYHRENPRVSIPCDIPTGEASEMSLSFLAPEIPGVYLLELDMVAEHVSFFQNLGSKPAYVTIMVVDAT